MDSMFEEVISRVSEAMSRLCSIRKEEQDLHGAFLDILQRQKPKTQSKWRSEDMGGYRAFWRALGWEQLKPCALCQQQRDYSFPGLQQLKKTSGIQARRKCHSADQCVSWQCRWWDEWQSWKYGNSTRLGGAINVQGLPHRRTWIIE